MFLVVAWELGGGRESVAGREAVGKLVGDWPAGDKALCVS